MATPNARTTTRFGLTRTTVVGVVLLLVLFVLAFVARPGGGTAPGSVPDTPPHAAESYEGSSGMGADGFGGYPADPASAPTP